MTIAKVAPYEAQLIAAAVDKEATLTALDHLRRCMAADSRVQSVPPCKCPPSWGLIALSLLLGMGGGFVLALALVRMGGALA